MDKRGVGARVTLTRLDNTTDYTAGDVWGGAVRLPLMGRAGGITRLRNFSLLLPLSAVPSGMTAWTLHLYNVTPPSALADNAPWDLPSGDRASYLGKMVSGANIADLGSSLFISNDAADKFVRLLSADLWAYLVTDGGYTPTALSTAIVAVNGEMS